MTDEKSKPTPPEPLPPKEHEQAMQELERREAIRAGTQQPVEDEQLPQTFGGEGVS